MDLNWNSPFRGLDKPTVLIVTPFALANLYNRRPPYVIQYMLNVERELGSNTALEVGYIAQ